MNRNENNGDYDYTDMDLEELVVDDDAGYEGYEGEEEDELKDIASQLEEDHPDFYKHLGNKKLALRESPSPIVFDYKPLVKSAPVAKSVAKASRRAKASPRARSSRAKASKFSDADDDVKPRSSKNAELLANKEAIYDAEVKKLWTILTKRHGNIPPWYQKKKGGTRKRIARRSSRRNKRSRRGSTRGSRR